MGKNYVPYVMSILFFTAALLVGTLLAAFLYGAVTGFLGGAGLLLFFRTGADALFLVGGIVLTSGALVEFFWRRISNALAAKIMLPYALVSSGGEVAQGPYSGGWMLIFSGATLALFSIAFAFMAIR